MTGNDDVNKAGILVNDAPRRSTVQSACEGRARFQTITGSIFSFPSKRPKHVGIFWACAGRLGFNVQLLGA